MPEQGNEFISEQPDWLEKLRSHVLTDTTLSQREQERRTTALNYIAARVQQEGIHVARPHPNRARQFMPFAALKGYHELAYQRERSPDQKHIMTEELSAELSEVTARLVKGCTASVMHYEGDRYITTSGTVTEIDEIFRFLCVARKHIAFDDIFSLEITD